MSDTSNFKKNIYDNIKNSINNMAILNFVFNFTFIIILSINILYILLKRFTDLPEKFNIINKILFNLGNNNINYKYLGLLSIIFIIIFVNFTIFSDYVTKKTEELNELINNNEADDIFKSILDSLNTYIPLFSITLSISLFFLFFLVIKNLKNNNLTATTQFKNSLFFVIILLIIMLMSIIFSSKYIKNSN